jgi:phosphoenolpyruvate-protein kinase (PTS system EI component)
MTTLREAAQATPHKQLISELLDSRVPKTEREHAAGREIERLQEAAQKALEALETYQSKMSVHKFDSAITALRAALAEDATINEMK